MPVGVGEIDRVAKERRFVEWNVKLKHHLSREARFGKQQIASARAAANAKIASGYPNLRKLCVNRSGGDRLLVWGEPWRLSIWPVDHVAAEKRYCIRRSIGLYARHRGT